MASLLLRASRVAVRPATRGASRHLCAVSKTSTGLVGLEVDPDYKNTLVSLYEQTLAVLEGIPEGASYRTALEATIKHNLSVVQGATDAAAIEEAIGLGQVEEIADMTRKQLAYLPSYIGAFIVGCGPIAFRVVFVVQRVAMTTRACFCVCV